VAAAVGLMRPKPLGSRAVRFVATKVLGVGISVD